MVGRSTDEDRLRELAVEEDQIALHVRALTGLMEVKHEALLNDGTYQRYVRILHSYLALIGDGPAGLEALKRAVFIAWYEMSEPNCFTGICGVDTPTRAAILLQLERHLRTGVVDAELTWMLPWYWSIMEYAFRGHACHDCFPRHAAASTDELQPDRRRPARRSRKHGALLAGAPQTHLTRFAHPKRGPNA